MSIAATNRPARLLLRRLADLQYTRNDMDFARSTFRVRGDVIDIFPAESDLEACASSCSTMRWRACRRFRPADRRSDPQAAALHLLPKSHYVTRATCCWRRWRTIKVELASAWSTCAANNKLVEAQRLEQRTRFSIWR